MSRQRFDLTYGGMKHFLNRAEAVNHLDQYYQHILADQMYLFRHICQVYVAIT